MGFETRRSETPYEKRAITKSFKMKFIIVAAFMATYLTVGVHSASVAYSISSYKLTVKSTVDVNLNIPIEEVLYSQ